MTKARFRLYVIVAGALSIALIMLLTQQHKPMPPPPPVFASPHFVQYIIDIPAGGFKLGDSIRLSFAEELALPTPASELRTWAAVEDSAGTAGLVITGSVRRGGEDPRGTVLEITIREEGSRDSVIHLRVQRASRNQRQSKRRGQILTAGQRYGKMEDEEDADDEQ